MSYMVAIFGLVVIWAVSSYMQEPEKYYEFKLSYTELQILLLIGNLFFFIGVTWVVIHTVQITLTL